MLFAVSPKHHQKARAWATRLNLVNPCVMTISLPRAAAGLFVGSRPIALALHQGLPLVVAG
jgi:hypothetical protein